MGGQTAQGTPFNLSRSASQLNMIRNMKIKRTIIPLSSQWIILVVSTNQGVNRPPLFWYWEGEGETHIPSWANQLLFLGA